MTTDGKFFSVDGRRFMFRGCHHRATGDSTAAVAQLREAGFTVLVTESLEPMLLSAAAGHGLRVLGEIRLPPWRNLRTASRREARQLVKGAAGRLVSAAPEMRGDPHMLGAVISPSLEPGETPSPSRLMRRVLGDLASAIHDLDADMLVAACLPSTAHECPIELDFLVTSPDPGQCLSTALAEAHLLVGDRPIVVRAGPGSRSRFDAAGYEQTVDAAAAQGAAGTILVGDNGAAPSAVLATPDSRSAVARCNLRSLCDLDVEWPAVTVVICAHNAAATLGECLCNVALLDYPRLEVIVVDDGSADETADIVRRHRDVRLISVDHAGLSEARNIGFRHARGKLVAYLDADAYPPPEWLRFIVLGFYDNGVVASGGPNVPPPDDPPGARVIAHCPGGPIPILYRTDRALHLPGCNMAFRREVLDDLGGFDPNLTSAEDVDLQLKLRGRGFDLGYHPAALVWHHRRPGAGAYLRQQRSYGRGQALAAVRNPVHFHRRRRYKLLRALGRQTKQEPVFLPVAYRSLRWRRRHGLDLAHQWGVPLATAVVATAPLGLARPYLVRPAAAAGAFLVGLLGVDAALATSDLPQRPGRPLTAVQVAALQLLRPLAFVWGTLTQVARLRLRQASVGPGYR